MPFAGVASACSHLLVRTVSTDGVQSAAATTSHCSTSQTAAAALTPPLTFESAAARLSLDSVEIELPVATPATPSSPIATPTAAVVSSPRMSRFDAVWLWFNRPEHWQADSGQRTNDPRSGAAAPGIARATVETLPPAPPDAAPLSAVASSLHAPPACASVRAQAQPGERALVVHWTDGTRSAFSLAWLAQHDYSTQTLAAARVEARAPSLAEAHWRGSSASSPSSSSSPLPRIARPCVPRGAVPTFSYASIMGDEGAAYAWMKAINEWGLALVTGEWWSW